MIDLDAFLGGEPNAPDGAVILSAEQLGDLIGVSARTVRELASKGIIAREAARYEQRSSVRAYCAHLREQAAGRANSLNLTQERVRVAREQGDALAMKNAIVRGEMVTVKEVASAWSDVLRGVRSAMLAVSGRVQQRLTALSQHDVALIDEEVRLALQECADV